MLGIYNFDARLPTPTATQHLLNHKYQPNNRNAYCVMWKNIKKYFIIPTEYLALILKNRHSLFIMEKTVQERFCPSAYNQSNYSGAINIAKLCCHWLKQLQTENISMVVPFASSV